jgi:hypothetical protein
MGDQPRMLNRWAIVVALLAAVAAAAAGTALAVWLPVQAKPADIPAIDTTEVAESSPEDVHRLCGACHPYPPPETFPRSAWRKEVTQGFEFFHKDLNHHFTYPPLDGVVRYYEKRAPLSLPLGSRTVAPHPLPVRFERGDFALPNVQQPPGTTHVNLVHLFSKDAFDILVCDAVGKQVLAFSPYTSPPKWTVLASGLCAAHAEVVDLDRDGIPDVIVAVLGSFNATDDRVGSVVWLKGTKEGTFTPITLLDGVGRVADVRAADFSENGKLDLVVAEFGWHESGAIHLLENQTTDWAKPKFVPRVLDSRHGTTHVPVADLNGDGRPDFVAVISQEYETVVAFINEGGGRFRKETIYTAPHPAWGCNGIQLVDLDGDGDLDVLLSNGDSLDPPYLLRPDHGVTWLENRGEFPFKAHRLADCYGAGSPVAADFCGHGRLDVAFVSFLPAPAFPDRGKLHLESVVLMEQTSPGQFVRHQLEFEICDHLTCAAGDIGGNGRQDLIVGNYIHGGRPIPALSIWRNLGQPRGNR